jgi:hypothetical protein
MIEGTSWPSGEGDERREPLGRGRLSTSIFLDEITGGYRRQGFALRRCRRRILPNFREPWLERAKMCHKRAFSALVPDPCRRGCLWGTRDCKAQDALSWLLCVVAVPCSASELLHRWPRSRRGWPRSECPSTPSVRGSNFARNVNRFTLGQSGPMHRLEWAVMR